MKRLGNTALTRQVIIILFCYSNQILKKTIAYWSCNILCTAVSRKTRAVKTLKFLEFHFSSFMALCASCSYIYEHFNSIIVPSHHFEVYLSLRSITHNWIERNYPSFCKGQFISVGVGQNNTL